MLDNRGLLHTGDHIVYLWKSKLPKEERKVNIVQTPIIELKEGIDFREKFNSILSGPAANNPSPESVRVVVNFGNSDKQVHFPSTSEKSRQSLFKYKNQYIHFYSNRAIMFDFVL